MLKDQQVIDSAPNMTRLSRPLLLLCLLALALVIAMAMQIRSEPSPLAESTLTSQSDRASESRANADGKESSRDRLAESGKVMLLPLFLRSR